MPFHRWREAALVAFLLGSFACGGTTTSDPSVEPAENTPTPSAVESPIKVATDSAEPVANTPTPSAAEAVFTDVTDSAGITFVHRELPGRMMPIGAGVVVLDFDGDKRDDIYFSNTNGANHLYLNTGDGGFEEMAAKAGVDDAEGEGNGGCAADYDNDGDIDLFVTNFGPSRLFQNGGDGTF